MLQRQRTRASAAALLVLLVALVGAHGMPAAPGAGVARAAGTAPALKVSGATLVDEATGAPVYLQGVNRGGGSWACVQGWGFTDGPSDQAMVDAMVPWNVRIVRIDFDSGCWLGTVPGAYSGAPYRAFMQSYIQEFLNDGFNVILDLHGIDPARAGGNEYPVLPDDSATTFWSQVASAFGDDHRLLFGLYNEPHDNTGWSIWKNGGTVTDGSTSYHTPGYQAMLNAVRAGGFHGVVLLDGESWANDFSGFMTNLPSDPDSNLAADWHPYEGSLNGATAFDTYLVPVKGHVPIVAGEFGGGSQAWSDALFSYFGGNRLTHTAWNWNTNDGSDLNLIADYAGTPAANFWGPYVHGRYAAPPPCTQAFVSQGPITLPTPAHVNVNNTLKDAFTLRCAGTVRVQYTFYRKNADGSYTQLGEFDHAASVAAAQQFTDVYATWKPSSTGTRYLQLGVFANDWSVTYNYNSNAGVITIAP